MTQYLTEREVRGIAEYARIGLSGEELSEMTVDLNNIIETLQSIKHLDLEGVEPTFHPIGSLSNVMREDVETESFTQQVALENAPKQQDGSFLIPSILGEGGDA
ncbi:Asp-tRNA(Asn)/Glu-tRNA(Gln) amidotransferase subunit GatC [uncultured Senegalimassilia sp.]|uniref:Asp-tRNA(Asn)/Glu-tRNA(Gln) amidotransferase subunit GatC n=1 Tax=uncultured Senegalimassilia sp. TaxID=1714350 RepID=UPI0025E69755|nr:Asp-tRNA(Asn)/Glu-tRNA(Gln) amidotransferase subunit GatC [uncultured Senegalimassilia sp.]